ncbi:hypothetical protein EV401DRAFT_1938261 [Pisolithus croceorrhizus]|nr:hypothetical protein EV401DRAFT_1938261 [Pisolithus croceorrhizus]
MAPSRAKQVGKDTSNLEGKSKKKVGSHPYPKKMRHTEPEDALPGVQKIKSTLRQAKRLLSKESLAANVRVETERRIKALEADLVNAQHARKLRTMASRYHKVKFFERQKVCRKIKQLKRNLVTAVGEEKARLELTLSNLRVDLNYILHYPPAKKYISLFPPEVRKSSVSPTTVTLEDDDERSKIRKLIRLKMEQGELSLEPDNEYDHPAASRSSRLRHDRDHGVNVTSRVEGPSQKVLRGSEDVSADEFFGDDNDEEEGSD